MSTKSFNQSDADSSGMVTATSKPPSSAHTPPRRDGNYRAVSVPPKLSSADAKPTPERSSRAVTAEPRHVFTPSSDPNKTPVQKGKEFEEYFVEGVEKAGITSDPRVNADFQKKVDIAPGGDDERKFCKPDALISNQETNKVAVVEMKNLQKTPLRPRDVEKTHKDVQAVKDAAGTDQVEGVIYTREDAKVTKAAEKHAEQRNIKIVREGEVDADQLAEDLARKLEM